MNVNIDLGFWGFTLLMMATTTIPVKVAANFVGASYTGMGSCALAVIFGTGATIGAYTWLGSGLWWVPIGLLAMTLSYKFVLSTSIPKAIALTIIAVGLQLATIGALVSFGMWSLQELVNTFSLNTFWNATS